MPRVIEPKGRKVGPYGKKKSQVSSAGFKDPKKKIKSSSRQSRSPPPKARKVSSKLSPKQFHSSSPQNYNKDESYIGEFILEGADKETFTTNDTQRKDPVPRQDTALSLVCRRSLALDTRFCSTDNGRYVGDETELMKLLVDTSSLRGVPPLLLSTTVVDPSKKAAVTISTTQGMIKKVSYVSGVGIRTLDAVDPDEVEAVPVNFTEPQDNRMCAIPNNTTAEITWDIYSNLVSSQVEAGVNSKVVTPFEVVLVGTDLSAFSDASPNGHAAGFAKFVAKVSPFFQKNILNGIEIIVLATRAVAFDTQIVSQPPEDQSQSKINECIEVLKAKMEELEYPESGASIRISLRQLNNSPLAIKHLTREWIRETIGSSRKITLELPATPDGSQCSIDFDGNFQTFPYNVTSPEAGLLLTKLHNLSSSKLVVQQSIALSAVDASLLYGVPIRLEAHLEIDLSRFRENQTLVRLFLHMLQDRGQALLLRHDNPSGNPPKLFLFMVKEEASSSASPSMGMIFQYATGDDLLVETPTTIPKTSDNDLEEAYIVEHLEESLGGLVALDVFNPLLVSSKSSMEELQKVPSFDDVAAFPPLQDAEMKEAAGKERDDDADVPMVEESTMDISQDPPSPENESAADICGDFEMDISQDPPSPEKESTIDISVDGF